MAKIRADGESEVELIMKVAQRYAGRVNRQFVWDQHKVDLFKASSGRFLSSKDRDDETKLRA